MGLLDVVRRDPRLRRAAGIAARATYATPVPLLAGRWELPRLLNRRRLTGLAFEIGVRDGGFSELLLRTWRGRLLVSVDPWGEPGEDELYEGTRRRLAPFGARSEGWRDTSGEGRAPPVPGRAGVVF